MKKRLKRVLIILAVVFAGIQFIRIDKTVPQYNLSDDLMVRHVPEKEVILLLKNACYDCHSYETTYPWYAEIAPVSWMVGNHIEEGRHHLNFSVWQTYDTKKQDHKLEECIEEIERGSMPEDGYVSMHAEADLSDAQKTLLIDYFKNVRSQINLE